MTSIRIFHASGFGWLEKGWYVRAVISLRGLTNAHGRGAAHGPFRTEKQARAFARKKLR